MPSHSAQPLRAVCQSPVTSVPEAPLNLPRTPENHTKVWHMVSTVSTTSDIRPFLVILRAFAEFLKANIDFVMSVCPSLRMKRFGSQWKDFGQMLYFCIF
jgi:hypothetical protein